MVQKFKATARDKKALQFATTGQLLLAKTQDFHVVFDSECGQRVLKHLAQFCYLLKPTADKDADTANRNEGRREVALHILEVMNYDEEKILALILNEEVRKKQIAEEGDLV